MTEPVRVRCTPPLTAHQLKVAGLIAEEYTPQEIAILLKRRECTVEYHIVQIALRIPGSLPRIAKIRAWYRGAGLDILIGQPASPLKKALMKARGAA